MERLQIIETLKHLPDMIAAEIEGVPTDVLRYRPAEGEWSIKEVIGHLRDSTEVWHTRLYSVWSQTDPAFVSFDGEAYVIDRKYQEAEPRALIADIRKHRLETVNLLSRAVDWTRAGTQPGVGRRSFKQFAEFMIEHEAGHLAQIRTLKAAAAGA